MIVDKRADDLVRQLQNLPESRYAKLGAGEVIASMSRIKVAQERAVLAVEKLGMTLVEERDRWGLTFCDD